MKKLIVASASFASLLALSGPSFAGDRAPVASASGKPQLICVCSSGRCTCTRVLNEDGVSVY